MPEIRITSAVLDAAAQRANYDRRSLVDVVEELLGNYATGRWTSEPSPARPLGDCVRCLLDEVPDPEAATVVLAGDGLGPRHLAVALGNRRVAEERLAALGHAGGNSRIR